MPKQVYSYESLVNSGQNCVVTSMRQLVELTGLSYRTIQRYFSASNTIYDTHGKWKVFRSEYLKDNRRSNTNPNIRR